MLTDSQNVDDKLKLSTQNGSTYTAHILEAWG